jgi:serine/threonine-protein kinase PknG
VYCDFKPDNVIQTEEQLKLIDMGGVRGVDSDGPIYGTVGYQAPEISTEGPTVSSDLFTVGRALAVLTFEFKGYQSTYKFTLPDGVPLLEQQESFARLLRRATHGDPERRFASAGEMAEQLTGVLREVLATADGTPRPVFSAQFSPEVEGVGTSISGAAQALAVPPPSEVVAGLPLPLVDRADPAAGYLATFAGLGPDQRIAALTLAASGDPSIPQPVTESAETRLALVRARIDAADYDGAAALLADLDPKSAEDPSDWRVAWYHGLRSLAVAADARAAVQPPGGTTPPNPPAVQPPGGTTPPNPPDARAAFDAVFSELPGEVAPKLALAFAAEAAGDPAAAGHYFRLVWTVDRSCISAAFGLARACLATGDRPGAIATLAAVPGASSHYAAAQIAAVRILVSGGPGQGAQISGDDLRQADGRLGQLAMDDVRREQLTVEILRAALDWCGTGQPAGKGGPIMGCEPNARAVRFGLERSYRALARLTPDEDRRIELVDMANAIRPRTLT